MLIPCDRCSRPAFLHHYPHGPRCAYHLREVYERRALGEEMELRMLHTETDAPNAIVTSVRVRHGGTHDLINVWNRGALSGTLSVTTGDGFTIAARLLGVARGGE